MTEVTPVQLDPFQRIVNVGWGAADILVLELSFRHNGPRPAFPLYGLPFTMTAYDLFDDVIVANDGAASQRVENPITAAMLKALYLWNRPPYVSAAEGGTSGNAILFFNLRKIRAKLPEGNPLLSFEITTPATGPGRTESGVSYYVWLPFVSFEEALQHPGLWIDSIWATAAEAQERLASLHGGGATAYEIRAEPFETQIPDVLSWSLRATTYRKQKDFPTDPQNHPLWNVFRDAVWGASQAASGSSSTTPLPSHLVTAEVDTFTLDVSLHVA